MRLVEQQVDRARQAGPGVHAISVAWRTGIRLARMISFSTHTGMPDLRRMLVRRWKRRWMERTSERLERAPKRHRQRASFDGVARQQAGIARRTATQPQRLALRKSELASALARAKQHACEACGWTARRVDNVSIVKAMARFRAAWDTTSRKQLPVPVKDGRARRASETTCTTGEHASLRGSLHPFHCLTVLLWIGRDHPSSGPAWTLLFPVPSIACSKRKFEL